MTKVMYDINPGWWNISSNKESYDLYYGIVSERLLNSVKDPFKIKNGDTKV